MPITRSAARQSGPAVEDIAAAGLLMGLRRREARPAGSANQASRPVAPEVALLVRHILASQKDGRCTTFARADLNQALGVTTRKALNGMVGEFNREFKKNNAALIEVRKDYYLIKCPSDSPCKLLARHINLLRRLDRRTLFSVKELGLTVPRGRGALSGRLSGVVGDLNARMAENTKNGMVSQLIPVKLDNGSDGYVYASVPAQRPPSPGAPSATGAPG